MITYKYKLYRTHRFKYLDKMLAEACFVWNHALALQKRYYRIYGSYVRKNDDAKTWWLIDINQKDKKKYPHPTIKPMEIVRTLIRNSSKEGDLVFDGFLGSGTTRVACYFENRDFIGCELDKNFYQLQEDRYLQDTRGEQRINGRILKQLQLF